MQFQKYLHSAIITTYRGADNKEISIGLSSQDLYQAQDKIIIHYYAVCIASYVVTTTRQITHIVIIIRNIINIIIINKNNNNTQLVLHHMSSPIWRWIINYYCY